MNKKSLYHSELVKLSPVTARIMSEPTESNFPGKPKWVALEIDGQERFLTCENVGVELTLMGLKGQWAKLNAKGRGDDAVIEIEDGSETKKRTKEHAEASDNSEKIKRYAAHSLRVFQVAWDESKNWLGTIPTRDAEELPLRDWYDLRLRVAQGVAIEINKIIRKERF